MTKRVTDDPIPEKVQKAARRVVDWLNEANVKDASEHAAFLDAVSKQEDIPLVAEIGTFLVPREVVGRDHMYIVVGIKDEGYLVKDVSLFAEWTDEYFESIIAQGVGVGDVHPYVKKGSGLLVEVESFYDFPRGGDEVSTKYEGYIETTKRYIVTKLDDNKKRIDDMTVHVLRTVTKQGTLCIL